LLSATSGGAAQQGGGFARTPRTDPSSRPPAYDEEQIDIPGTHVPAWVVAVLVVGVILVLAGAAILFLR
jgi:hypothetical protein